jgi:hypothetical protein
MGWRVRFIPDDAHSIVVSIDNKQALIWTRSEGDIIKDVPPEHANKSRIFFECVSTPHDGHVQVFFDDALKKNITLDRREAHELER